MILERVGVTRWPAGRRTEWSRRSADGGAGSRARRAPARDGPARRGARVCPGASTTGSRSTQVGDYRVSIADGAATVTPAGAVPQRQRSTSCCAPTRRRSRGSPPAASPVRLLLGRRLRSAASGARRSSSGALAGALSMRDVARAGVDPDPDLVYRALPYAIDPEWTRGHRFTIAYEMQGDAGGEPRRGTSRSTTARWA